MIDAAMVHKCADPSLKPAIVERFLAAAGSPDPLAITVKSDGRVVLIPPPKTVDEAMDLMRHYVGQAVVRVGITQYPAGLGIKDPSQLSPDLIDPCANIKMGTMLFSKVYRIVTSWYGAPVDEAFDDAILAWQSGYFEGKSVFREPDPADVTAATPNSFAPADGLANTFVGSGKTLASPAGAGDPNTASIRIDLSSVGGGVAK